MTKFMIPLTLAIILFASVASEAQYSNLKVTTTIHNTDASGIAYRIKSDGSPYVSLKSGKNVVESQIQGIGDWELNTRTSTTRKVFIDLRDSAGGSGAPFQTALVPTRFMTQCEAPDGINLQALGYMETRYCGLNFGFDYNGSSYGVRMRSHLFDGTTDIPWTCTAFSSGRCRAWTVTPDTVQGDGTVKGVGRLIKLSTKRNQPEVDLGNFYFSFRITLTAP